MHAYSRIQIATRIHINHGIIWHKFHDNVIKWKHFPRYWPFVRGNTPVNGEFPTQRPATRSFDVSFDLRLNKCLNKQSWGWWFETPSWSLWRHRNVATSVKVTHEPKGCCNMGHHPWINLKRKYRDIFVRSVLLVLIHISNISALTKTLAGQTSSYMKCYWSFPK